MFYLNKIYLSVCIFFLTIFCCVNISADAIINNGQIGMYVATGGVSASDPCDGTPAIGTVCSSGTLYAGQWNSSKYMTTPSGCSDWADSTHTFTPVCPGGATSDSLQKKWAANDGRVPTGYNVLTGASSTTDGSSNTTVLAAYADTDLALYCANNRFGGYSDWFLPAASSANDTNGEMYNVLYVNRVALGGFQAAGYLSSTETDATNERFLNFNTGAQGNKLKTAAVYFRCVRKY